MPEILQPIALVSDEADAVAPPKPEVNLESLADLTVDQLMNSYINIKENLEALTKEYNAKEAVRKERLKLIAIALHEKSKAMGVTQFKVEGLATAYHQKNTRSTCADYDVFGRFLFESAKQAEADGQDPVGWVTGFFERRVHQSAIETFIANSETKEPPPGINITTETVMVVRRVSKK